MGIRIVKALKVKKVRNIASFCIFSGVFVKILHKPLVKKYALLLKSTIKNTEKTTNGFNYCKPQPIPAGALLIPSFSTNQLSEQTISNS